MEDWLKFYGLADDPFSVNAIVDERQRPLFHVTGDIQRQVLPFLRVLGTTTPRVKLIVSDRGMGKTSLLRYCEWEARAHGMACFYVRGFEEANHMKSHVDLAGSVLRDLLEQMIVFLVVKKPEVYGKFRAPIDFHLAALGKQVIDGELFAVSEADSRLPRVSDPLREVIRIYKKSGIRFCVFFDNLDKYDAPDTVKVVLDLLKMPISQSVFEEIVEANGLVFLALATSLYQKMQTENRGDFSFLDDPFTLQNLKPIEAQGLLATRFSAGGEKKLPFEEDAIVELVRETGGNIRRLFQRARRGLEFGAAHELLQISAVEASRAQRELQGFPAILRDKQNSPELAGGLRFISRMKKQAKAQRVALLIKAAWRAKHGKKISPTDRQILEENAVGGKPIQAVGTSFEMNDQDLINFISMLDEEGQDVEGFADWLCEGSAVPEFLRSPTTTLSLLAEAARELVTGSAALKKSSLKLLRPGYQTLTYQTPTMQTFIVQSLQDAMRRIEAWPSESVDEGTPSETALRISEDIVFLYRAYGHYLAALSGKSVDTGHSVVLNLTRIIQSEGGLEDPKHFGDISHRLVLIHKEARLGRASRDDSRNALAIGREIVGLILRTWTRQADSRGTVERHELHGIPLIASAIDQALRLSETKFVRVSVPGKTLKDFSLYLWPGKHSYWAFRVCGKESTNLLGDVVSKASGGGPVGEAVKLGKVVPDTNVLVKGGLSKLAGSGLLMGAQVVITPSIRFQYEHNSSKSLRNSCQREVGRLNSVRGSAIQAVDCEKVEVAPFSIERDGVPGEKKAENLALSQRIDHQLIAEAVQRSAILFTVDGDLLGDDGRRRFTVVLADDGSTEICPVSSIQLVLQSLIRDAGALDAEIFSRNRIMNQLFEVRGRDDTVASVVVAA